MSYPLWMNLKVLSKISAAHPNDTSVQYFYTQWFFLLLITLGFNGLCCVAWTCGIRIFPANHGCSLRQPIIWVPYVEVWRLLTEWRAGLMSIFLRERTNGSEFKGLGIFQFEPQQKNSWLVAFFTQKLLVQFTVYWPLFDLFRSSNGLVQKP